MSDKIKSNPYLYVQHIDTFGKNLSVWEINFIADLLDNPSERYTEKQIDIITRIYDEKT